FKAWIIKILTVKINNKQKEFIKNRDYREELDVLESVEQERSEEINYSGLEIMEEFRRLNEDERLVLSLSIVSGYTSDEIARATGLSANTVRSKVARAKIKLKKMLSER
ncbi:MAG: sigma-70 family RNA polymerase sigma factor, partial [Oscillospiraceae bacterium]|nr:sigma-70 family RNA polymerase sigma factor [Oscillospiraceae bacterium]